MFLYENLKELFELIGVRNETSIIFDKIRVKRCNGEEFKKEKKKERKRRQNVKNQF